MPRLTNRKTGVVVNVSDDKARRLGDEWQPVRPAATPKPKHSSKKK